jgi:small-conductance mechanosensitive channel
MSQDINAVKSPVISHRRSLIASGIVLALLIALVVATSIVSKNDVNKFITKNENYILSIEIILLVVFFIEALARFATLRLSHFEIPKNSSNIRLIIRIIGYTVGVVSVISILASNTALGISVGAIAGVVIAFATQSIGSSVLAAILIIATRMIKIGEEITISGITGTVSEIALTHTTLSAGDDVVFIPNSVVVTTWVRRKKRHIGDVDVNDW